MPTEYVIITPAEHLRKKRQEKINSLKNEPKKPYVYKGDEFWYTHAGERQAVKIKDGALMLLSEREVKALEKQRRRLISKEEVQDDSATVAPLPDDDKEAALKVISEDDYQGAVKLRNRLGIVTTDNTKESVYEALTNWLSEQTKAV